MKVGNCQAFNLRPRYFYLGFFLPDTFNTHNNWTCSAQAVFRAAAEKNKFEVLVDTVKKVFIIVELSRAVALPLFKNINQNNLCGC